MSFASEQKFKDIEPPKKVQPKKPVQKSPVNKNYVPMHAAKPAQPVKEERRTSSKKGLAGKIDNAVVIHKDDAPNDVRAKLVTITAVVVIIVCLVILGFSLYQDYEAKKNHDDLKNLYSSSSRQAALTATETTAAPPVTTVKVTEPNEQVETETAETEPVVTEVVHEPRPILPAAAELLAINPDTVGYVRIPDCVDEPVVKGTDDEYYLTHNFWDQQRSCGTCFADFRNIVGDWERTDVVTLYAHNQRDGTMFGNLDYYRWDYRYWQKNPFIYFNTNYSEDVYVIISSFVTNIYPEHDNGRKVFDYQNFINFEDEGDYTFDYFYSEIMKRSWFDTGIDCTSDDKYLTLSTCSTEWDDSRHVIVARMLRENESPDTLDTTKFEKNPNPKWPGIYYKYHGGTYED